MAIKVNNTTVIDDSRNITNLGSPIAVNQGGTGKTSATEALANLHGFATTVTASGTTTLTSSSAYDQTFTGTSTQTISLPVTSTLTQGWSVSITNLSTGNLTVNSSGGNLVITVLPNTTAIISCTLASGTTAASWKSGLTNLPAASSTQSGYITSQDWQLFNSQGTATVNSVGFTLGTTGNDLNSSVTNPTTTPSILLNVPSASASSRGVLTSADWTTFNGKQAALVSGTNIKTINGNSILGSGDLALSTGGGTVTSVTGTAPISVATGTTTPAISIAQATAAVSGYLSTTDWNTFNNKQAALVSGTTIKTVNNTTLLGSGNISTVTSVTGTSPISVATGTTTPAISIAQATAAVSGYLSSTDWNTFNNKQTALVSGTTIKTVSGKTLLGSGDLGVIGPTYGGTGLTAFGSGAVYSSATNGNFSVGTLPVAYGGTGSNTLAGAGILTTTALSQGITVAPTATGNQTFSISTSSGSTSTGAIGLYSTIYGRDNNAAVVGRIGGGGFAASTSQAFQAIVDVAYSNRFMNFVTGTSLSTLTQRAVLQWNSGASTVDLVNNSDYRLKENIAPIDNATTKIKALKPVSYDWKYESDASKGVYGFIAHEFAEVIPYAVVGEKDAINEDGSIKPQTLNYNHTIPLLTAALQEALKRIEVLEAEVSTLKSM